MEYEYMIKNFEEDDNNTNNNYYDTIDHVYLYTKFIYKQKW